MSTVKLVILFIFLQLAILSSFSTYFASPEVEKKTKLNKYLQYAITILYSILVMGIAYLLFRSKNEESYQE